MNPEDTYQSARNWSILDDILFMKKKADDILIKESHNREDFECSCGWNGAYPDIIEKLLKEFYTACPDCGHGFEDY